MERVDVVIVGQGVAALAAATRAAVEGVRAIAVDRGPRLTDSESLLCVRDDALDRLGLDHSVSEQVNSPSGDHVILASTLGQSLEARARTVGVGLPPAVGRGVEIRLEAGGWHVTVEGSEPIRAPLFVLAEDARAPLMEQLGLGRTYRVTSDGAEIATWAVATWRLPPSELSKHPTSWLRAGPAPLSRTELLVGRDRVTLRVGPIWGRGIDPAEVVARAARKHGLPVAPSTIEIEEVRLDALPCPTTIDGGMVIGQGVGHAPRTPGHDVELEHDIGEAAGAAAAKAVLAGSPTARALEEALSETYRALVNRVALAPSAAPARPVFAGFTAPDK